MPHYHFDVFDGNVLVRDEEGARFPSLEAAEVEADDVARELAASVIVQRRKVGCRELRVRDELGETVSVIEFRDVLV